LNDLARRPLTPKALQHVATALGADVPFFLHPGACLATGIGEVLSPMPSLPDLWFVLVNPGFEMSAGWVYGRLAGTLTSPVPQHKVRRFSSNWSDIGACLSNDLEAAILPRFPVLATLKERLIGLGAAGALVSGSGPTVFGVFREEAEARRAAARLRRAASWRIFLARSL
jgi:4-diphosphocytidyl-2-C-methyl-D-erythritol kinase